MADPESQFGFDQHRTFWSKLGRAFVLLLVGAFFGIFTVLVFQVQNDSWWLVLLKVALEVCWTFWILAMLYVWFDWDWLKRFYVPSEHRMVRLASIARWGIPLFAAGVIGFVWYLTRIGVLPLRPK